MKILAIGTTFPRWPNDTEPSFVYELSQLLAEQGIEVIALVPHHKGAKKFERMGKVKIIRFPYFFSRWEKLCYDGGIFPNVKKYWYAKFLIPLLVASELVYAYRIAKKEKVDALHAHWIVPQGFVAAIVKKLTGIPYIVTAHAGDIFPLRNKIMRWTAKVALKNCFHCTANSNATKKAVESVARIRNISVIPMGVDLKAFSAAKRSGELRKKLGINGEFILTVGRMAEKKGFRYLIEAMLEVLKKLPKAKLVLVGDGPQRKQLEQQAQALNLKNNVIFAGKMTHKEIARWYASADVFVLPSIITDKGDTEGLGIALLEAAGAGTPIIGSNVGGIPDIIKHGKTGLLVPQKNPEELANAITKILTEKKLGISLSKNASQLVKEQFAWALVADKFAKLFNNIRNI